MTETLTTDFVVAGAGLSGLVTARRLVRRGHSVLVLEADDRAGGRLVNLDAGDGVISEGGGQWIGPKHTAMADLLSELGLKTFPTYTDGRTIYLRGGRRRTYGGTIPPMRPLALLDFAQAQFRLERMAATVPAAAPWRAGKAAEWDSTTLGHWLRRNCRVAEARHVFELGFTLVFAEDLSHVSLLKALHQISTSGGIDFMMNTENGAQETRVAGGTQAVADAIAGELGDRVRLGSPVTSIEQDARGVLVRSAGLEARCRRVVVAMTPADAGRIKFLPELPTRRAKLQRAWRNGGERKICVVYERPFWRDRGLNGSAITDLPIAHYVVDNSPPDATKGILMTFIGTAASGSFQWTDAVLDNADARRDAFVDDLVTLFGAEARKPERYLEKSWIAEPWIAGVAALRTPGVLTNYTDAATAPVGRVHWAGAETSVEFESYMEGAVRAAERAVAEVDAAGR
ncbi:flavin monoamine oxidase family protein [Amycolatopsis australiensis]|uniref:Monoamine oxidase n=1 Tax=Amycolatopsis australiensis TaxID=546364 RepID=A0A1K1SQ06_9PSEU|nr:FAD-dependent oxidoreductase [Amycolatopsis australiensis]SFW86308.1 monoamine oxidase [Amycolatopsis australiensis]